MLSVAQTKELSLSGWPDNTLLAVDEFLQSGVYTFYNLANLGCGDFRLMYREQVGIDAKNNPITKMQCKLGKIIQ